MLFFLFPDLRRWSPHQAQETRLFSILKMCSSGESITAVPALISWKFIKLVSLGFGAWVIALRRYRKVLIYWPLCVCFFFLKKREPLHLSQGAELSFGFETFSSKCPLAIGGNRSLLLFSQQVISDSFATPQTVACQTSLSMGFFRQACWSGLSCPSPGDLPSPGNKPDSPALAGRFFTTEPPRKPGTWEQNVVKEVPSPLLAAKMKGCVEIRG